MRQCTVREGDDSTEVEGTAATQREGSGVRSKTERDDDDRVAPGTTIGRYVITDLLGAGGMGVVYSAFDPELDRKVAIKLLQAKPGGSESGGQAWLLREAQAMARLAHPNVVAVHDVGTLPGDRVFVAMELIAGTTLRTWLKQPRTWREVLPVLRQAGAGLAAAHAAGLVHRDFKPDNVIVGDDGRVRVMDFGLARREKTGPRASGLGPLEDPTPEALALTGVLGTPAYMAPEIYRGERADARSDQFAFGVALYEALFLERPFKRDELASGRALPPAVPATPKIPAWIARVAVRAIALDPAERFASMDALLAALAREPGARTRRIVVGAVLAVVLGTLGTFAYAMSQFGRNTICLGANGDIDRAWGPNQRAALEVAFHRVPRPAVDEAVRGTEKALDAYAEGWVHMSVESCKATHRHDQSDDVFELRYECLQNRLAELEALVDLFARADESVVLGSVTTASKLSALDDCANVAELRTPDPLPKDPMVRRLVGYQQQQLAEARAMYVASRPAETLAITTKLAPEVLEYKHLPTEAELHLLAGQALWVLRGADQGEPELIKAAATADAGKAETTKLEAWIQLTNLATEGNRFDVAMQRWQFASAALARVGDGWQWKVRVLDSQALLDSRSNKYDDAIAVAKQARVLAEPHPGTRDYAYALLIEATVLNASTHAAEALDDFKKVLAYQETLGHDRYETAATLQNLASAELQLGRVDDALGHTTTALAIDEDVYGPKSEEVGRALGELGAARAAKGDQTGALATFQRALEVVRASRGTGDDQYAQLLGQLAGTLLALGRTKEALPYYDQAIAIQTKRLGPSHVQTLVLELMKCDAQESTGAFGEAVATCSHALAVGEQALGPQSPILFLFLAHTGQALLDAKRPRDALPLLQRALALGGTNPSDVDDTALLAARALWDGGGDRRRAVELATRARDGYVKLGSQNAKQADEWLKSHGNRE